ncbi:MAG: hypothetical protein M1833_001581 [Piccolia ochrophora]|nr:MAG: hypothetical protein M1833_001581 [Piccolia ochrophora]
MSSPNLHAALLRPPVLHILRAAGFHATRPSVMDTVVDLTVRYLLLLASTTVSCASANNTVLEPQLEDVRMAMQQCGVFRPQMSVAEEEWVGEEDMRGLDNFLEWIVGDGNREIRRVAGMQVVGEAAADAAELEKLSAGEDFLSVLKKKHSKTGEESRYQGTVLGKTAEDNPVKIEGGPVENMQEWMARLSERRKDSYAVSTQEDTSQGPEADVDTMRE